MVHPLQELEQVMLVHCLKVHFPKTLLHLVQYHTAIMRGFGKGVIAEG